MRFLVDNALSPDVSEGLRLLGHDAAHLRDYRMQAAMDSEVLKRALIERRILITSDKDFGEILAVLGMARPSVIIFREAELNPTEQLSRLVQILSEVAVELERGAVVVIRKGRFRVRSLPIRGDQSDPTGACTK